MTGKRISIDRFKQTHALMGHGVTERMRKQVKYCQVSEWQRSVDRENKGVEGNGSPDMPLARL